MNGGGLHGAHEDELWKTSMQQKVVPIKAGAGGSPGLHHIKVSANAEGTLHGLSMSWRPAVKKMGDATQGHGLCYSATVASKKDC